MENGYFVLYKRDRSGEKMERAKGRMLYDSIKEFETKERAISFGLSNLQDTPILAKKVESLNDYKEGATYVIAAYFTGKYQHYSYDGSCDSVPTHEITRCDQGDLDRIIEKLANEDPSKIYLGIEEKLVPSALDRIRSINEK